MAEKPTVQDIPLLTDPVEAAQAARLRYVSDQMPGIRREGQGENFIYTGPRGERITDAQALERFNALAIPPAWTEVWICPRPNGHLLATGRDAKGRKQYIYHPRWREIRDQTKFNRMIAFGEALPHLRQQVDADLAQRGLPRTKVLAAVVRLLETTRIRVGNEEYARLNESFGLTTLHDDHVTVSGASVRFEFTGKSGKPHTVDLRDRRLANVIRRCQELPGHELFQYLDDSGTRQTIDSGDVNEYVRAVTGSDFTAKDFRTWSGTVLAIRTLVEIGPCRTKTEARRSISQAVRQVAADLGNTTAVSRQYYIHPVVLSCYEEGTLCDTIRDLQEAAHAPDSPYALSIEEQAVIAFLRCWAVPD